MAARLGPAAFIGCAMAACAGGGNPVRVLVSPASVSIVVGDIQQFTATVTGSSNVAVIWSVQESGGGSVNSDGLYTAPGAAGVFHVLATSAADASKSATATVTVSPPPGCYNANFAPPATGVSIGVIRWDAWFAEPEKPPLLNRIYLFAHQFFERVPFYATLSSGKWVIASDKQDIADREIDYAVTRGIDYWAFVYWRFSALDPTTGALPDLSVQTDPYLRDAVRGAYSLDLYLSSQHCDKPRFALIVQADGINSYINTFRPAGVSRDQAWQIIVSDLTAYLKRPEQHMTPGGRPILFVMQPYGLGGWGALWDGDSALAKSRLEQLRQSAVAAGAARPFILTMAVPDEAVIARDQFGFDGVSHYGWNAGVNSGPGVEVPFAQADPTLTGVRQTDLADGLDVIPPLSVGWDSRPYRPFDPTTDPHDNWWAHGTPAEIVAQLDHGIQFVKANPSQTTAKSVIIYNWNELGEGGVLVPTLAEGTARLDAIAQYLGKTITPSTPSLAPVLVATVSRHGTGCTDGYGIWLEGAGFDSDSYLQIRSATLGKEDVLATYPTPTRGTNGAVQTLSICLTGAPERSAFAAEGVRVSVVNPSQPSTSTPEVVHF